MFPFPFTDAKTLLENGQRADPHSMLALYTDALRIRHGFEGGIEWLDLGPDVLAFRRGDRLCITNFADRAIELPNGELLLASDELTATGELPPDSTAWLRTQHVALEAPTETRKA